MSERRITEKPKLNPQAVRALDEGHPAMTGNHTIFPSTVVTVTESEPDRILVSGHNNRKIGQTVEKGAFKNYAIFMLTLEERATCPEDCDARAICYGNGMHFARRHRIGDPEVFFDRLGWEVAELTEKHEGVLIRLHVLGDFPSVEYVNFWKEALDEYPNLACYGYTHRAPVNWGGDEIGEAIQALKLEQPERFRIRWSMPVSRPDGAIVIDAIPDGRRTAGGDIVCPAQTDATACCATCALCWAPSSSKDCIAFIKHGPKSALAQVDSMLAAAGARQKIDPPAIEMPETANGAPPAQLRAIQKIPGLDHGKVGQEEYPEIRHVEPSTLVIEERYQRNLSPKSIALIKRIVAGWSWSKFKPPVVAETRHGLCIIDGQHTSIAAASHPGIDRIPVIVVASDSVEGRADAFVAHNRDRVAMTANEIFHAAVAAGDPEAVALSEALGREGAEFPRSIPRRGQWKSGQLGSPSEWMAIAKRRGHDKAAMVARVAVRSKMLPVPVNVIRAIEILLFEPEYGLSETRIVQALQSNPDIDNAGRRVAIETKTGRGWATAVVLYRWISNKGGAA